MPYIIIGVAMLLVGIGAWSYLWRTPQGRGALGEACVKMAIGRSRPGKRYVIHNLMLRVGEGKTAQIDHVLINRRGVFVVETKNYSGRICGTEDAAEWTQVLGNGRVKNKLYNPIKQNKSHIYHVSGVLQRKVYLTSVVVFVQGNIRGIDARGVYDLRGMRRLFSSGRIRYTEEQMREIYEVLTEANDTSVSMREHIENIRENQRKLALGICPRCGRSLVLKKKKGVSFYRCRRYPKCQFKKSL